VRRVIKKIFVFLEMIKFEHSLFALPFAYAGLFLAKKGLPPVDKLIWVTGAMISFRTSAMALNRLFDQEIDSRNPRTRMRALPAGFLKRSFVWGITLGSVAVFVFCAYRLNPLCFLLSWIPIVLAVLYPFSKRFTWGAHFLLGAILGLAPYGAWLAAGREFSWIPGLMTLGVAVWVAGFDMIYAMQDREFDVREGLYSFPACFGEKASLNLTGFLHGIALLCWAAAGFLAQLGVFYFSGLVLASGLLLWENTLIRVKGIASLQQSFFTLNVFVSVSLFVLMAVDLIL